MKAVYICAILVILTAVFVKADVEAEKEKLRKVCQQEVPVTADEVNAFFKNPSTINDAMKCYFKCLMEKEGLLKGGQLDIEAFMKTLETYPSFKSRQAAIIKAGNDCKAETGANECDSAFKIFMCLAENESDLFGDE